MRDIQRRYFTYLNYLMQFKIIKFILLFVRPGDLPEII